MPVLPEHYMLPTVMVRRKADGVECLINKSEFDSALHEKVEAVEEKVVEEEAAKTLDEMTAKELRAYASENLDVELAKNLSKAKLLAAIRDLESG